MIRIRSDRWNYFKGIYDLWGFEYNDEVPGYRCRCYCNKKDNVIIYYSSRVIESTGKNNFELIYEMTKADLFEFMQNKDDEDLRLVERIEKGGNVL